METHLGEMILTIVVLSFWFLFPIGMFLSVSHVDKNTDQIIQLGHHRHWSSDIPGEEKVEKETPPAYNLPKGQTHERPEIPR